MGMLGSLSSEPIQRLNGYKNVLGTVVNAVAAIVFVPWPRSASTGSSCSSSPSVPRSAGCSGPPSVAGCRPPCCARSSSSSAWWRSPAWWPARGRRTRHRPGRPAASSDYVGPDRRRAAAAHRARSAGCTSPRVREGDPARPGRRPPAAVVPHGRALAHRPRRPRRAGGGGRRTRCSWGSTTCSSASPGSTCTGARWPRCTGRSCPRSPTSWPGARRVARARGRRRPHQRRGGVPPRGGARRRRRAA